MVYGLPAPGEANWDTKLDASIEAVKATADAAKTTADAALPAAEKGAASGVAPLDATGLLPDARVPDRLTEASLNATFVRSAAVGGSTADQSALINNELAALPAGKTLQLPQGVIYLDNPLALVDYATLMGTGRGTALYYRGTGALCPLINKVQVKFRNIRVHLTAADQIAFDLSNSFRCSWTGCIIEGEHVSATDTTYRGQVGIRFRDNAGDCRIIDCDLNNLGIGIDTASIMNYVSASDFGSCWRSIVGGDPAGDQFLAGLSVVNCTLVGSPTAGVTDSHVLITGSAAEFWFSHVWMEKADNTVIVGNGSGGPRSFGLRDARVSGRNKCVEINRGNSPVLQDVTFGNESGTATPVELFIDAAGAPTGTAQGLRSVQTFDFADSVFPAEWFVYRRGVLRLPASVTGNLNLAGTVKVTNVAGVGVEVAQDGSNTSDLLSLARGGVVRGRLDAFGNYYATAHLFQGTNVGAYSGTGTPEGVVSAGIGSTFHRRDGAAGTSFYVKESGAGNTGWVAK